MYYKAYFGTFSKWPEYRGGHISGVQIRGSSSYTTQALAITDLFGVLAMLEDDVSEDSDAIIDATAILLLDEVVDLAFVWFLGGVGIRGGRGAGGTLLQWRKFRFGI